MIFVVEDDQGIRELEGYALEQAGYEVQGFEEGGAFFAALAETVPQLVLLDVMLPGEDGYAILKRLRQNSRMQNVPVLMITARDTEMDKVRGLDGGADDYMVKPFGVMEMLSRVKALLRRAGAASAKSEQTAGRLRVDGEQRKIYAGEREIPLTYMEFELLRYLIVNRGIALSRERLLDGVWGMDYAGDGRTVDVHMRSLRVKLRELSGYIQTVRGVGYRLEENDGQENL